MTAISISVSDDLAQAYSEVPQSERRKLELLLNLRLRDILSRQPRSLAEIMNDIGSQAAAAGLTREQLEALLHDD